MQSIRKRLDGNIPQFIEDVRKYGRWEAMRRWDLEKSYLQVTKIILEETGNENFGLHPIGSSYVNQGIQGLLREVVAAFADYVIKTEMKNEELRRQLEAHKANSNKTERDFAESMIGLLETLKSA